MHKPKRDGNATFSRFYMESKVAKNTYNCRYLSVGLLNNSTAIKQLLQQQLWTMIGLSKMGIAADLSGSAKFTLETIPLHRLSDDSCIVYRSAIALKLASVWQRKALDIANQLMASLPISHDGATHRCLDFSVEVVPPGWINFRLSDQALASWLQQMIQIPPTRGERQHRRGEAQERESKGRIHQDTRNLVEKLSVSSSPLACPKDAPTLFQMQYAHARCCSLLRMAHRQGLIQLRDLDFKTLSWQLVEPNPIPWLNHDQRADSQEVTLRLVHPTEQGLIGQILDWQDELNDSGQGNGVKQCRTLSRDFERFYSSCRILGEVKTQTPKLAQARLGLLAVTQGMLRSLLQDQLGVPAPVEL
jgi:arginyl-tRNA synthetase